MPLLLSRMLVQQPLPTVPPCCRRGADTAARPPSRHHLPALSVTGTRNYTCQTQTLSFGPSLGIGKIDGQLANGTAFTCDWYYSSAFSAIVACRTEGSAEEFGYSLDTTVRGAGALRALAALCRSMCRQRCVQAAGEVSCVGVAGGTSTPCSSPAADALRFSASKPPTGMSLH